MNWAIVADILLVSAASTLTLPPACAEAALTVCFFPSPQYVVVPTRRSTAEALQIVFSHLLGDAGSPYLIGVVRLPLGWTHLDSPALCC